ncbi:hypothetical protein C2G38_2260855 [Gigaspora rosea]|uniref:Uncharacterized protein n=1 Tax=Gigaspora rosea TaxID=44941 RepID=A0A397VX18_9GLOM|nr:hypothetical protein C2G38_2260855 [Gigaspora rosea]
MSNYNNLFVKKPEKIECSLDITLIANNDIQLYLEDNNLLDFSHDFLSEIVNEICNLYIKERMKGKDSNLILESLEQFLINKKQNPVNIINFCLDNQINIIVQIILASCFRYGKWVEKDEREAFNYIKNWPRWMILTEYFLSVYVMKMELELKRMNARHSFIIKNLQRWKTLMGYIMLDIVIIMKLELKKMNTKHSLIIKNLQRWGTRME